MEKDTTYNLLWSVFNKNKFEHTYEFEFVPRRNLCKIATFNI